ncbi:MAG: alpha/beta hydrolase [Sandaracinus sp.]|nr:alpha/beta hydrolase [Sandaracinus sp.]
MPGEPDDGPWWERLPEDFAKRPEPFELMGADAMRVRATAATDVAIRSLGATLVGSLAMPLGYRKSELTKAREETDFYLDMAKTGDPSVFFREPPKGVRVRSQTSKLRVRFQPEDGYCETVRFDSPFMPVNPRLHSSYLKHRANRVAHARYWRHADGPRPTMIAVHGFSADLYLLNEWFFAIPWFYRMGFDVMLLTLPFHGIRQTRFSPFSGHGYFAGGPSRINEAVAQSVMDTRIYIDWLMNVQGSPAVGITGVSLGGFTTSMLAATEHRLAFAIPNVPVVSFADIVLEWEPIGTAMRALMKREGMSVVDSRKMLAVSCPLSYPSQVANERLLIVGGVGDRLAPPKHSRVLWEHWDRPGLYWFPGSHLAHLDRGAYLVEVARFLRRIGFLQDAE